jgi:hypothetical protein
MIGLLRRFYSLPFLRETLKHDPQIRGHVTLETREGGKLRGRREGYNIWTLTGREYLAEVISIQSLNPTREVYREDRVGFLGIGTGAQAEVPNIQSLVEPVPYKSGEFLAHLAAPASFPVTGVDAVRTAAQYIREFGQGEISLGFDVVLSEAGLYTDGDPDNNNDIVSVPTDFATSSSRAPVAYKTFEPITKTINFTLRVTWEVRFI